MFDYWFVILRFKNVFHPDLSLTTGKKAVDTGVSVTRQHMFEQKMRAHYYYFDRLYAGNYTCFVEFWKARYIIVFF